MSFQTNEHGILHRNTFSQKIVDAFGAVRERNSDGSLLTFDEEKINELRTIYGYEVQGKDKAKDAAPITTLSHTRMNITIR